jgi:16S rRNA processing protein RimM
MACPDDKAGHALVVVGRIGGPHGVAGAVRVVSFTQPPGNLLGYRPWLVGDGADYRTVEIVEVSAAGASFIVRLAGVADRDAARQLRGRLIAVPRDALPAAAADEYYWQDLIGMTVVDSARGVLGTVTDLLDTGAHDVLVIDEGVHLVPFVAAFVAEVDPPARTIRVTWHDPV